MKRKNYIDGQRPKRDKLRRRLISAAIALVLVVATIIAVRHVYTNNLQPVSSSSSAVSVEVPLGSTTKEIAELLHDQGLIRAKWAFQWYINNAQVRDKLQAGTYELRPNQSVEQIVAQLTHGAVATKLVTIVPGKRIAEVKQAFVDSGFDRNDVEAAFNPSLYKDSPVLADMPKNVNTLEGLLYPDSFQRDNNTKPEQIIRQSLNEMQKKLTPDVRASFTKQGLTTYQGLILASIVEREVSITTDRPIVAQVFLKRLSSDIQLGSDATSMYGALKDKVNLPKNPTAAADEAIAYDSVYNTRIHDGLPPTPISTVEQSAILAVAKPAKTNYLYFVTGKDCKTHFSKTLAEHEANVKQYGLSTDNTTCN